MATAKKTTVKKAAVKSVTPTVMSNDVLADRILAKTIRLFPDIKGIKGPKPKANKKALPPRVGAVKEAIAKSTFGCQTENVRRVMAALLGCTLLDLTPASDTASVFTPLDERLGYTLKAAGDGDYFKVAAMGCSLAILYNTNSHNYGINEPFLITSQNGYNQITHAGLRGNTLPDINSSEGFWVIPTKAQILEVLEKNNRFRQIALEIHG